MKQSIQVLFAIVASVILAGCGGGSANNNGNTSASSDAQSYAYITDGTDFKVIDITDPMSPVLLDTITTLDSAYKVSVTTVNSTPLAYVAESGSSGNYVNIVDLSDRSNLSYAGISKGSPLGKARDFYMDGTTAYIADEFHGLHVIDLVQNIFNPTTSFGADAVGVTKFGGFLYLMYWNVNGSSQLGVEKLDISNPANVTATSDFNTIDISSGVFDIYTSLIEYGDSHIFVANIGSENLVKLDPNTLQKISEVDIGGQPTALAIYNGYAYITMHPSATPPYDSGVDAIGVVHLASMTLTDTKTLQDASGVSVYGDKVFATDSTGLHIYTVANGLLTLENTFAGGSGNYITMEVDLNNTARYTRDDTAEVVTDHLTGLKWQDNADVATVLKPWVTSANYTAGNYADTTGDTATTYCTTLTVGGYTDWRLPTQSELLAIQDSSVSNPSIDSTFQNTASGHYDTATDTNAAASNRWIVSFGQPSTAVAAKSTPKYVRCVR